MPLFQVTIKQVKSTNRIECQKGMSVDIPSISRSNPLTINGGKEVQDAFMRLYGVDLKKAGALSSGYLNVSIVR